MAPGRHRRFPLIEGLRGLAALSVLAYHAVYKGYLLPTGDGALQALGQHLDVGVTLFFLISGFLLYRPFVVARLAGDPPPDSDSYARRRILRIVPAYWVVLLLAGALGLSYDNYPAILSLEGAPYYFGFLQIYDPQVAGGGINVAWTLCVEITFYALLPVWALMMRRFVRTPGAAGEYLALGVLALSSITFQLVAVNQVDPGRFGSSAAAWIEPLPNFLDQFALGMALAVASAAPPRGAVARIGRALARRPWIPIGLSLVAYWVMATRLGLTGAGTDVKTPGRYLAVHQLKTLVAAGILLPAVLGTGGWIRGALASRPLRLAGALSYGIYLVHVPVLFALLRLGLRPTDGLELARFAGLGLIVTLALAWVLHHLVELPFMRLGRRARPRTPRIAQPEPGLAS